MTVGGASSATQFADFVDQSWPVLRRSAVALTGDTGLAEDLVQEVYLRLVRHWDRITRDKRAVLPYAQKVLYRIWLDHRRYRSRRPRTVSLGEHSPPVEQDTSDHIAQRADAMTALEKLSPMQRAVIVQRYIEDRSERETALTLNITVAAVHSHAQRALKELRHTYGAAGIPQQRNEAAHD